MVPGRAAVVGDVEAAVAADEHVPAVLGVDPEGVVVRVDAASVAEANCLAAVGALPERGIAEDVDELVVARVDTDVARSTSAAG